MRYIDCSIKNYLKDLGSGSPSPGGGSSAALAAAMAASLVSMACYFTLGKEKYKRFDAAVKKILEKSVFLEAKLSALIDQDIQAYKDKDLQTAIEVPREVCFAGYDLLRLITELLLKGNKNLFSDLAMAAALAESSFSSCLFYIRVNAKMADTRVFKNKKLIGKLSLLLKKVKLLRKTIEVKVGKTIGR